MSHVHKVRIYYEDTDCGGVVYYANYLRYCERARTEFLESRGVSLGRLMAEGIFFVVAEASLKYFAPGRYADVLAIHTVVERAGPASITFRHEILRDGTGDKLVEAVVKLGCVAREMKPLRLPKDVADAVREEAGK
ncbi:MAG: tol-pal system-associated acyl-CoA thioesterase [Thermodesulfovibrionales bacterium]